MAPLGSKRGARVSAMLGAVGIVTILPLFLARQLPLADLPEHAAVSAALAHWNDPAWRIRDFFTFDPTATPYWLYDAVGAVLARLLGDARVAHVILLSVVGISMPFSAAHWLRSLGRDPRLGVCASILFWSKSLLYGLLPFVASIPIFFLAIAEYTFMLRRDRARLRHSIVATLLGTTLVLLHVTTFFAFVLAVVGMGFFHRRRGRACPVWLRTLPLGGLFVVLFYGLRAKHHVAEASVGFVSLGRMLASIPEWSFDAWHRRDEKAAATLYWMGYLGVFLAGFRTSRSSLMPWWPLFATAAMFFFFPFELGTGLMLNVRLGPLLALLVLPALRLRNTKLSLVALSAVLLGIAWQSLVAGLGILEAQATLGDFDAIIRAVPVGSRVLHLPFDPGAISSFRHVAAAIRVERGGLGQYSFTQLAHWPLQDRVSPKKPVLFWDRRPCIFDPDLDPPAYDAILVTGAFDPFQGELETTRHPSAEAFELAVAASPHYLWLRKAEGVRSAGVSPPQVLHKAPCSRWARP